MGQTAQSLTCSIMEKPLQGWMNVRESYSHALEHGTLFNSLTIKLGGARGKFGDYLCVHCANLPCVSGHNQFTNTKLTRPITKI